MLGVYCPLRPLRVDTGVLEEEREENGTIEVADKDKRKDKLSCCNRLLRHSGKDSSEPLSYSFPLLGKPRREPTREIVQEDKCTDVCLKIKLMKFMFSLGIDDIQNRRMDSMKER